MKHLTIFLSAITLFSGKFSYSSAEPLTLDFSNVKYLGQNREFSFKDLTPDTPALLIYFSPSCEHCKDQAKNIRDAIADFNQFYVLFVSKEPVAEISTFFANFSLQGKSNMVALHDQDKSLQESAEIYSFPTLFFFNRKHVLVERIKGTRPAAELIEHFKNLGALGGLGY